MYFPQTLFTGVRRERCFRCRRAGSDKCPRTCEGWVRRPGCPADFKDPRSIGLSHLGARLIHALEGKIQGQVGTGLARQRTAVELNSGRPRVGASARSRPCGPASRPPGHESFLDASLSQVSLANIPARVADGVRRRGRLRQQLSVPGVTVTGTRCATLPKARAWRITWTSGSSGNAVPTRREDQR